MTVRPAVPQPPVTPVSPDPATVTCSSVTRADAAAQDTSTPGPGPRTATLDSSAAPPSTRTRPATVEERTSAPPSISSAGPSPPSSAMPRAPLPGSWSRRAGASPLARSRVTSAPRPMTPTGRPGASANAPVPVRRPSTIVSRSASDRAAAKAAAGVSRSMQPGVRTPTQ